MMGLDKAGSLPFSPRAPTPGLLTGRQPALFISRYRRLPAVSRQRLRGLAPLANAAKRCSPPLQRRGLSGRLFDTKVFHSLFPTTPKQIGIKRHLGSMKNTRRSMSSAALNVAAPKRVESSVLSGKSARDGLCQFPFTDGRTCRMPIAENHPCLCLFHSRDERQLLASQEVPARLASLSGHFKTASDINHVLGQLFRLVAENRIPRRDALALAYIAQLLPQTLPHVRAEISEVHTAD